MNRRSITIRASFVTQVPEDWVLTWTATMPALYRTPEKIIVMLEDPNLSNAHATDTLAGCRTESPRTTVGTRI